MAEPENTPSNIQAPTEQDASTILQKTLGKTVQKIERFPTGLANYVYDVRTTDGQNLVVRLARPDLKHFFEGAIGWYDRLKGKGVPLPALHYADASGLQHGFPVMIMDRLPGEDLGDVYRQLSSDQKRQLARKMVKIQNSVATLPFGKGYGYAESYDDPDLHKSWTDVLNASLERSNGRIKNAGVFDIAAVDKVRNLIKKNEAYFSKVKPIPFLDDATTKNVVIAPDGALSGIVDVDHVAFGDPLFAVALTRMSLLAKEYDTEYTDDWAEELRVTEEQKKALDVYTALFCVDFMGEVGQTFNKAQPEPIDQTQVSKLNQTIDELAR